MGIITMVIDMLKCFSVKGFKNFSEKITLDFSNVRDYRFNSQCLTNGLVSKSIVYGKNSVGKTNLGLAIFDIVSHLTNKNVTPNLYDYYLCSDGLGKYAEFDYVFRFDDDIIKSIPIYDKIMLAIKSILIRFILLKRELKLRPIRGIIK